MDNFSEADVSNLDPRWRRARADRCARAQTGKGARTRLHAPADASACVHTFAKKMDPSRTVNAQELQQFRVDYLSFKHQ